MKQKKQKIMIAFLAVLTVAIGSWLMMKPNGLRADEKKEVEDVTSTTSNLTQLPLADDDKPWLPKYQPEDPLEKGQIGNGYWLDATVSYIPKENAVGFKYYSGGKEGTVKTQIIGWSDGIGITKEEDGTLKYEYGFGWEQNAENPKRLAYNNYVQMDLMKGKQWIAFNKVGFYEGLPIAALVKITPPPHLELDYDDEDGNKDFNKISSVGIGLNSEKVAGVYTAKYDSLFSIIMGPGVEYVDVSVEFFRYNGKNLILNDGEFPYISEDKISLSPYWTFDKLKVDKYLTFNQEDINNIYSVSRDFTPLEDATILSYRIPDLNPNKVEITPIALNHDIQGQLNHLFTYIPKKDQLMQYHLRINPTSSIFKASNGSYYNVNTPVKIEFPDPQASTTVYTEIISNGKGLTDMEGNQYIQDFGYQFIQSVPWEAAKGYYVGTEIDNRTQYPIWTINSDELSGTVYPEGAWDIEAKDDLNLDTEKLFTSEENKETGTVTIKPFDTELTQVNGKDVIEGKVITGTDEETEFYNHYYAFQKNVMIDYKKPISKSAIEKKDGKPLGIFDFTGKVILNVVDVDQKVGQEAMNQNRPKVPYKTEINFLAPITYTYLDKNVYDSAYDAAYTKALEDDGVTESVEPTEEQKAAATVVAKDAAKTAATIPTDVLPDELKETDKNNNVVPKKGQAIVTWQVPLTPTTYTDENLADPGTPESATNKAPTIPGYEYVAGSAELNAQKADYQVKVTKYLADGKTEADATAADYAKPNEVVLFYNQSELVLEVPDTLNFTQTEVPLKEGNKIILRDATKGDNGIDWYVKVTGGLPSTATGYQVTAKLEDAEGFCYEDSSLPDILQFKRKKDDEAKTLSLSTPVTLFTNEDKQTGSDDPIGTGFPVEKKWEADEGFLLDLSFVDALNVASKLRAKDLKNATYTATIEVSLDYVPVSNK